MESDDLTGAKKNFADARNIQMLEEKTWESGYQFDSLKKREISEYMIL